MYRTANVNRSWSSSPPAPRTGDPSPGQTGQEGTSEGRGSSAGRLAGRVSAWTDGRGRSVARRVASMEPSYWTRPFSTIPRSALDRDDHEPAVDGDGLAPADPRRPRGDADDRQGSESLQVETVEDFGKLRVLVEDSRDGRAARDDGLRDDDAIGAGRGGPLPALGDGESERREEEARTEKEDRRSHGVGARDPSRRFRLRVACRLPRSGTGPRRSAWTSHCADISSRRGGVGGYTATRRSTWDGPLGMEPRGVTWNRRKAGTH